MSTFEVEDELSGEGVEPAIGSEPTGDEPKRRGRKMGSKSGERDPELAAMARVARVIRDLPLASQRRVLAWACDKVAADGTD
jgi:hypothetical protein